MIQQHRLRIWILQGIVATSPEKGQQSGEVGRKCAGFLT
jgi:hypothetical protein